MLTRVRLNECFNAFNPTTFYTIYNTGLISSGRYHSYRATRICDNNKNIYTIHDLFWNVQNQFYFHCSFSGQNLNALQTVWNLLYGLPKTHVWYYENILSMSTNHAKYIIIRLDPGNDSFCISILLLLLLLLSQVPLM